MGRKRNGHCCDGDTISLAALWDLIQQSGVSPSNGDEDVPGTHKDKWIARLRSEDKQLKFGNH